MQVKQRLDALTSLRFVAAAMIVIHHLHSTVFSGLSLPLPLHQGVSFFFVLSGFILTWNYPVLADWTARRKFWLARFARIWPLHLVTCLLWIALVMDFDRARYFPGMAGSVSLAANLLLLQVWAPWLHWPQSFNAVSWSISDEFFFYAVFPLLVAAWQKGWHRIVYIQAILLALFLGIGAYFSLPIDASVPMSLPGLIYFNPLVRLVEFTVGIALAKLVRRIAASGMVFSKSQWMVFEVLALSAVISGMILVGDFPSIRKAFGAPLAYYLACDGIWLLWALLIGVFALSHGPLARLLSLRIAVYLGEISFALYLSHYLLITYFQNYALQIQQSGTGGYLAFWGFLLAFAALLFAGVETPCRKFILQTAEQKNVWVAWRDHFRTKEIVVLLLLACIVGTMFLLRPSTIVKLDQAAVSAFLQPSPEQVVVPKNVGFDQRYGIAAVRVHEAGAGSTQLQILLRAMQTMHATDVLALHLNDQNGKIVGNFGKRLDFGRQPIPSGTYWVQTFDVPRSVIEGASSLGLAMYASSPTILFNGEGGVRDWGGKRLILPLSPTTVGLDQAAVSAFLQPSPEQLVIPKDVSFDQRYGVAAVRVHEAGAGTVQVQVLLRAMQTMHATDVLALHLNDQNGKIVGNFGKRLDFGRQPIPSGTYWVQTFEVPRSVIEGASSLGLAMYASSPTILFNGEGGVRDWGGKRLILPLSR